MAPLEQAPPDDFRPLGFSGRGSAAPPRAGGDFLPLPDRWRIGIPGDYVQNTRGAPLNPYDQNVFKGDYPILGQDKFLIVTLTSDTLFEARQLPTGSTPSALQPGKFDFFGNGNQQLAVQNFILSAEFFQGDSSYKPRDFEFRATAVGDLNYVHANETQVINPDFREGHDRFDHQLSMQELFVEKELADLSPNYDFVSLRAGIQGFSSDFRGFLFSDNEPGIRLFGSLNNNKLQYNLAAFSNVEKDTNSGLNTFDSRDQAIFIANVFQQDFLFHGYTAQLSFHANIDQGNKEFDQNGGLARPAPIGTIDNKEVDAYYVGWAGDGHIGRLNLTHQFYQAFGRESFNPIAGQGVSINAQFFAAELSYDVDYIRYRASFAYASGDSNPEDKNATGFDTIFDNPNFAGGGFNFFTRQAIRLADTGVNLVNRNSFVPDLRTSKEQGQSNFVNPGLFLYNVGADFDLTPKLKLITNVSYLQFATTDPLRVVLQDNKISRDIGIDYSAGVQYRPLLNNNVILTVGAAALTPARGFRDIFTGETLYSAFVATTFTY